MRIISKAFFALFLSGCVLSTLFSCSKNENRFAELDRAIAEKDLIWSDFHHKASVLKERLESSDMLIEQAAILDSLYYMYEDAFPDSTYYYGYKRWKLKERLNDPAQELSARMDLLRHSSVVNVIPNIDEYLALDTTEIRSYGLMKKYLDQGIMSLYRAYTFLQPEDPKKEVYAANYISFLERYSKIDSTSARYAFFKARLLRDENNYSDEIALLLPYCVSDTISEKDLSVLSTYLARSFQETGEKDKAEYWYAKSAVCDIHCAKHMHMSLAKLAMLLADRGENMLALEYLRIANEDALSYNGNQRVVEISPVLSHISSAVIESERRARIVITFMNVLAVILFLVTIVALNRTKKYNKKLRILYKENKKISNILREANILKENYMMHYMVKCTRYIRKVDDKVSELKLAMKNAGPDGLISEFHKPKYSDSEFKAFYREFDQTFLKLSPHFIEELNNHVVVGEKWELSKNDSLPMELRVLAVMKIGILDNKDIAAFLNFPESSIYTYRYRIKKKLNVDDEALSKLISSLQI